MGWEELERARSGCHMLANPRMPWEGADAITHVRGSLRAGCLLAGTSSRFKSSGGSQLCSRAAAALARLPSRRACRSRTDAAPCSV